MPPVICRLIHLASSQQQCQSRPLVIVPTKFNCRSSLFSQPVECWLLMACSDAKIPGHHCFHLSLGADRAPVETRNMVALLPITLAVKLNSERASLYLNFFFEVHSSIFMFMRRFKSVVSGCACSIACEHYSTLFVCYLKTVH